MRISGRIRKIGITVLAGILAASCTFSTVLAAETKPSLTIEAMSTSTGKVVANAVLSYFRVADLADNGIYTLTETFKESGLKLDEFHTASAAHTGALLASAYIDRKNIAANGTIKTDKNGEGKAENLDRGLYLIRLTDGGDDKLIVELEPFFVSLPAFNVETGGWTYGVKAQPKITTDEKSTSPTETTKPTEPTDPTDPDPDNPTKPDPDNPTNPDPDNPTKPDPDHPTDPDPTRPTRPDDDDDDDDDPPDRPTRPNNPDDPGSPDGPGTPEIEIPDEPVPLQSFPGPDPGTPVIVEIPDEPVPLVDLPHIPKLGDMGASGYLAGMMISLLLCGTALTVSWRVGRKKEK